MPKKRIYYVDILFFLEKNISKLVKLKVASRAKFMQYGEALCNYDIADSIDDAKRYGEEVNLYYHQLLIKLMKAITEDKTLLDNDIVNEYQSVMLPSLKNKDRRS